MYKSIKYRIYPNKKQLEIISQTFGCCRKIWNLILEDKIKSYETNQTFGSKLLSDFVKEYTYLNDVDYSALYNTQKNLLTLIKTDFKKKGFPKFKSFYYGRKSYTTNNSNNRIELKDKYITLPIVGDVKSKIHTLPREDAVIRFATISKDSDGRYYCSVTFKCTFEPLKQIIDINNAIGLDYCSNGLYIDDKGNIGTNHKYFKESEKKLAKLQRRLAKKQGAKKGETKSNNYLKLLQKVNKVHRHIKNQRNDNLHKISNKITNHNDVACVEDLNMVSMSQKPKLEKSTMDNGYGYFIRYLEYKLNNRGKKLIKVGKYFPSSQICSNCGKLNSEIRDINIRDWECPVCGAKLNRDINAAINIKNEGLRLLSLQ